MNIIDLYKHRTGTADDSAAQRAAFAANGTSAAAWRVRAYLLATGSGAIISSGSETGTGGTGTAAMRGRFTEMAALSRLYSQLQAALADTALDQMVANIRAAYDTLAQTLAEKEQELKTIGQDIIRTKAEIAAGHEHAAITGDRAVQTAGDMARAKADAKRNEALSFNANAPLAALENRAIKIVRNVGNFAEFRNSLRAPETQAPEIYVIAAFDAGGHARAYDRIVMAADGHSVITRIDAAHAPAFIRDADAMTSDMTERAYARRTADGRIVFERMEYGANGALMGRVGDITARMLADYTAATGRVADAIAPDASLVERRYRERENLIENYADASGHACDMTQRHSTVQDEIAQIKNHIKLHEGRLGHLHDRAQSCREDICALRSEMEVLGNLQDAAMSVRQAVALRGALAPGAVIALLPRPLHSEFKTLYRQREWQAAVTPQLSLIWPGNDAPAPAPGLDAARALSRQMLAAGEKLRLQPA